MSCDTWVKRFLFRAKVLHAFSLRRQVVLCPSNKTSMTCSTVFQQRLLRPWGSCLQLFSNCLWLSSDISNLRVIPSEVSCGFQGRVWTPRPSWLYTCLLASFISQASLCVALTQVTESQHLPFSHPFWSGRLLCILPCSAVVTLLSSRPLGTHLLRSWPSYPCFMLQLHHAHTPLISLRHPHRSSLTARAWTSGSLSYKLDE